MRTPSPRRGEGWGEGVRKIQKINSTVRTPSSCPSPHSASKTRVNALMGEKGRSATAANSLLRRAALPAFDHAGIDTEQIEQPAAGVIDDVVDRFRPVVERRHDRRDDGADIGERG